MTSTMVKKSPRFIPTNRLEQYDIVNEKDQDMGQVQNFVVDMEAGRIALVIVAFGGMLGISDKWFAMPWELLAWNPEHKKFILDMPQNVLETAPGLKKTNWMEEINADWVDKTYSHFGLVSYLAAGKIKTDQELQQDVMDELRWEPAIKAADIGVTAKDGIVTLSGNVDSYWKKWAAERVAARVSGVKAVAEEIQVRLPGSYKRLDDDLAREAANALDWNVAVPHDSIKVQTRDGAVTLSGEVDWWYQKEAAEDTVRKLVGVISVINNITIKPSAKPVDAREIEGAFRRDALLDGRRITTETRGNKVILKGDVHTWAEREQAERAAWAAQGVLEVENGIVVKNHS